MEKWKTLLSTTQEYLVDRRGKGTNEYYCYSLSLSYKHISVHFFPAFFTHQHTHLTLPLPPHLSLKIQVNPSGIWLMLCVLATTLLLTPLSSYFLHSLQ